jgi:hypothetical protein
MKKLDGAGLAKMQTLDNAVSQVSRVHSIVERMALAVRSNQDTSAFRQQIQRAASPLIGMLKGQFGLISDQVAAMMLVLTRGGGEQMRLRALREQVAQIRAALEIAVTKVKEQHMIDDSPVDSPGTPAT